MSELWKEELDAISLDVADDVVALRRHLHAHPEPSGEELQTSLHLYQSLGKLELDVRMGPEGCGVIADGGTAKRRVAIRGDIDALCIQDEKTVEYRSTRDGVMHACGHDAHAAAVYGAVLALARLEKNDQMPWPVAWRAIFQPAEETAVGAQQMIDAGALAGIDAIVALHVDPARRTGEIGIRAGRMTAHCDSLRLIVRGEGGHAARPHESIDPIAASALLINTLYQFVSRATDSLDAVVVTIGKVQGGVNPNVIPDRVDLSGTVRTLDAVVREKTIEQIRQVVSGVEEITGTQIDLTFESSIPSVYNDAEITRMVRQVAEEVVGEENVALIARSSMGSEDFACYLQHVPGSMFRLGCAGDLAATTSLHTPKFDVDERSLAIGSRVLARSVIDRCCPEKDQVAPGGSTGLKQRR